MSRIRTGYLCLMASIYVSVGQAEIVSGNAEQIILMYPRPTIRLAKLIEDSISVRLPGGDSLLEIQARYSFCARVEFWELLPWVAYLGDSHYLRLLKNSVHNFRLVTAATGVHHIPEKVAWERVIGNQLRSLDKLARTKRIPKRQWRTRRRTLQQYLRGDG